MATKKKQETPTRRNEVADPRRSIDPINKVIERANTQQDIVNKLSEDENFVTEVFTNPAIASGQAFTDSELMYESIRLALRKHKGTETIVFVPGDYSYTELGKNIRIDTFNMAIDDIASEIAEEFLSDERHVGWKLEREGSLKFYMLTEDNTLKALHEASDENWDPQYVVQYKSMIN